MCVVEDSNLWPQLIGFLLDLAITWGCALTYDCLIFSLTALKSYRTRQTYAKMDIQIPLMNLMIRDGTSQSPCFISVTMMPLGLVYFAYVEVFRTNKPCLTIFKGYLLCACREHCSIRKLLVVLAQYSLLMLRTGSRGKAFSPTSSLWAESGCSRQACPRWLESMSDTLTSISC